MSQALQKVIPVGVSDLFYNTNKDDAFVYDRTGDFAGFDHEQMLDLADETLVAIKSFALCSLKPADLVTDFYARIGWADYEE